VDKLSPVEVPVFLQNNILMKRVVCGKSHTLWIDTNNNLWSAGRGVCTGLGSGDTNELLAQKVPNFKAIHIAAGEAHSMAIEDTTERQLFTWGFGGYGCLGHGDRSDKKVPRHVTMFNDKKVARRSSIANIAAGGKFLFFFSKLPHFFLIYIYLETNIITRLSSM
jgi:alpha-tubulin suppressor-like RCC1 family protein